MCFVKRYFEIAHIIHVYEMFNKENRLNSIPVVLNRDRACSDKKWLRGGIVAGPNK